MATRTKTTKPKKSPAPGRPAPKAKGKPARALPPPKPVKAKPAPAKKPPPPAPAPAPPAKQAKALKPVKAAKATKAPADKKPAKPLQRPIPGPRATLGMRRQPTIPPPPPPRPAPSKPPPPPMLPVRAPDVALTLEDRARLVDQRLSARDEAFHQSYQSSLQMSWIYHDSALEGTVYTFEELNAALNQGKPLDVASQPVIDEIRRHREAINYIRSVAASDAPVTLDTVKEIYLVLHPEEGDLRTVKYRKEIPQHRLYFHDYATPDKIIYRMRQIIDWLADPETTKANNPIKVASRVHYDILRVFPFPIDSGKVARLLMNLLIIRSKMPPAIIHSSERQRYYDAIKASSQLTLQMVQESVESSLSSITKLLDEHETRSRSFPS